MKPIKFGEIKINSESRRNVLDCLDTGKVTAGKKVKEFERRFADLFGYRYCVMMASGTVSLTAAFMTLWETGNKKHGNIIFPAISFISTYTAARMAGFDIKLVDVDWDMCLRPELIENIIDENTRAICAVNLMGHMCQLDKLKEIANKYHVPLILDDCEGYFGMYKGKYPLEYADMQITSHYPAHILPTGSEAGTVLTNDSELDRLLRMICDHGREPNTTLFDHKVFSGNFKNTDIHAALGSGQISNCKTSFNIRKSNLNHIRNHCISRGYNQFAIFNKEDDGDTVHAPHAFSIILKDPIEANLQHLKCILQLDQIEYKINFRYCGYHQCMKSYSFDDSLYPIAQHCGEWGIHLGVHEYLDEEDLNRICQTLDKFFETL